VNAKKELLELTEGEEILAISIGSKGYDWGLDVGERQPLYFSGGKVVDAFKLLDFEFDEGYGGEEGHSLYVWTKTKVIVKGTYDGAEWYEAIPRNPDKNKSPQSIGGG